MLLLLPMSLSKTFLQPLQGEYWITLQTLFSHPESNATKWRITFSFIHDGNRLQLFDVALTDVDFLIS